MLPGGIEIVGLYVVGSKLSEDWIKSMNLSVFNRIRKLRNRQYSAGSQFTSSCRRLFLMSAPDGSGQSCSFSCLFEVMRFYRWKWKLGTFSKSSSTPSEMLALI
ncbi:ATP-dependent Clp protease ATP-binding subunit ClpX [Trichinella spiralis]|uniref:ATP-dependent Clp protease ATP-binding subunit ClpX n=1 Tax=Trichinella spiralis TaxID=6334 RepID=A0ABR3KW66_TRISP